MAKLLQQRGDGTFEKDDSETSEDKPKEQVDEDSNWGNLVFLRARPDSPYQKCMEVWKSLEDPTGKYVYDRMQHEREYQQNRDDPGENTANFHTKETIKSIEKQVREHGANYIVADSDRVPNLVFKTGMDVSENDRDTLRKECNKFKFVWDHWFSKNPVQAAQRADELFGQMEAMEIEVEQQQRKIEETARLEGAFESEGGPKSGSGRLMQHVGLLQLSLEMTGLGSAAQDLKIPDASYSQRFGFETVLREGVTCLYAKEIGSCGSTSESATAVTLQDVYSEALFLHSSADIKDLVPEQAYLHFTKYLRKLGILHEIIQKNSGAMLSERRAKTDGTALDNAAAVAEV